LCKGYQLCEFGLTVALLGQVMDDSLFKLLANPHKVSFSAAEQLTAG
jgi:hypothetical protein